MSALTLTLLALVGGVTSFSHTANECFVDYQLGDTHLYDDNSVSHNQQRKK
jgi:hypothetical protein